MFTYVNSESTTKVSFSDVHNPCLSGSIRYTSHPFLPTGTLYMCMTFMTTCKYFTVAHSPGMSDLLIPGE